MKSGLHGKSTLTNNVTSVNALGLYLLVQDREYFVPFADYPAFKSATLDQIFDFQQIAPGQFHWRALDVDIEVDALGNPNRFPLMYR